MKIHMKTWCRLRRRIDGAGALWPDDTCRKDLYFMDGAQSVAQHLSIDLCTYNDRWPVHAQ